MNPNKKMPATKPESFIERADYCRMFLVLHEFLTESESQKVRGRLKKYLRTYSRATENLAEKSINGKR